MSAGGCSTVVQYCSTDKISEFLILVTEEINSM